MLTITQTDEFSEWLGKLRDQVARAKIIGRMRRARQGNLGDVAPAGEGVSEMRIHHGPGYRVYFVSRGDEIVILLCGGDKSTQDRDIKRAKDMAKEV